MLLAAWSRRIADNKELPAVRAGLLVARAGLLDRPAKLLRRPAMREASGATRRARPAGQGSGQPESLDPVATWSRLRRQSAMAAGYAGAVYRRSSPKRRRKLTETNQVVFRVTLDATKPKIAKAVEELFKVKVTAREHRARQGQDQGVPRQAVQAQRLQESDRDPRQRASRSISRRGCKMALKQYRPMTNGQRQLVLIDRTGLHKGGPVKSLTEGQHRHGGRNNTGRVTVRWQGGGHKQRYRIVDFKRRKFDMPATVERLEYDPNRTAFIALHQVQGWRARLYPRAAAPCRRRHRRSPATRST